jgi:hypothetical protein
VVVGWVPPLPYQGHPSLQTQTKKQQHLALSIFNFQLNNIPTFVFHQNFIFAYYTALRNIQVIALHCVALSEVEMSEVEMHHAYGLAGKT